MMPQKKWPEVRGLRLTETRPFLSGLTPYFLKLAIPRPARVNYWLARLLDYPSLMLELERRVRPTTGSRHAQSAKIL